MNPQVSSLWLFMFTLSEETFKLTSSRLCRQNSELSAHSSELMLPQMPEPEPVRGGSSGMLSGASVTLPWTLSGCNV